MNLHDTIALLTRTPPALDALLRGLPSSWTHANEGADSWNVVAILQHLIHAEHTDWMPRVRRIIESGESRAFDPFDRSGPARPDDETLEQLLEEFAHARTETLRDLQQLGLEDRDLERRGRHPTFGSVTLAQLLATWAAHDLTHLHQISRVMAHQYREAVGPWSAFLGVLQCDGHSSPA